MYPREFRVTIRTGWVFSVEAATKVVPHTHTKAGRSSKPKRHILGQRIKVTLPAAGLAQEEWKRLGQKTTDSPRPDPHPAPALPPEDSTFSERALGPLKSGMNTQSRTTKHLKKTLTVTQRHQLLLTKDLALKKQTNNNKQSLKTQ